MKINLLLVSTLLLLIYLSGCKGKSEQQTSTDTAGLSSADSVIDGEKTIKFPNGKPHYIVEYKGGKANGRVREYRTDGTLYMDAVFLDGHRHGKCTSYFKSGSVYSESNYINGNKEGVETKYYEDGKLLATNMYLKDKVLPGLKEFNKDGTEIKQSVSMKITEEDHTATNGKYYLKATLSDIGKNANFYASTVADGPREKLKMSGNSGVLEIKVSSRNNLVKELIFDAEFKTSLGNTCRLQQIHKLRIKR